MFYSKGPQSPNAHFLKYLFVQALLHNPSWDVPIIFVSV